MSADPTGSINVRAKPAQEHPSASYDPAGASSEPSSAPAIQKVPAELFPGINWDSRFMVDEVECKPGHSSFEKAKKAAFVALAFSWNPVAWVYAATKVVLVEQGNVGLSMNNGEPELLGPGWHFLLSPFRSFSKQVPINTTIQHGVISVVTVVEGHLGLALDMGKPVLLGPGMHQWRSPTMTFQATYDLSQPVVKIGPYTHLIVKDGTVAVTYDSGKLDIKNSGYHILRHERHQYMGEILVTDQFDEINELNLITSDKVSLRLDCTVHYKITDARSAALKAGNMKAVRVLVQREAVAAMTSTVAKSRVDDVGLLADDSADVHQPPKYHDEAANFPGKGEQAYQGSRNDKESIIRSATRTLLNIGVQLVKIAVRRIEICDLEVAQKLANQAVIRTNRMEKLDTADVEKQTVEIRAQAEAASRIIAAKAKADEMMILADAKVAEAKKLAEVGKLLKTSSTGGQITLLQSVGDALAQANATTIFVPNGDLVQALTANANFMAPSGPRSSVTARAREDDDDVDMS